MKRYPNRKSPYFKHGGDNLRFWSLSKFFYGPSRAVLLEFNLSAVSKVCVTDGGGAIERGNRRFVTYG